MTMTTQCVRENGIGVVDRCVLSGDLNADAKVVLRWLRAASETHDDEPELMSVSTAAQELIGRMARRIAVLEADVQIKRKGA